MANAKRPITCIRCGETVIKEIAPWTINNGGGKYCSAECYHEHRKEKPKEFKPATCHPEEKHIAFGLCEKCYGHHKYMRKREKILKEFYDKWRDPVEKKKLQEKNHNYRVGNPKSIAKRYNVPVEECAIALSIDHCEVCNSEWRLVVDHNHDTLRVRGRICGKCNSAIGMVDDDIDRLLKLCEYLKRESIYDSDLLIEDNAIHVEDWV